FHQVTDHLLAGIEIEQGVVWIDLIPGAGTGEASDVWDVAGIEEINVVVVGFSHAGGVGGSVGRVPRVVAQMSPVIIGVHLAADAHLLEVVHARDAFGAFLGPGQGGQQQRRQDGDDRDNHQQFNESKSAGPSAAIHGFMRFPSFTASIKEPTVYFSKRKKRALPLAGTVTVLFPPLGTTALVTVAQTLVARFVLL